MKFQGIKNINIFSKLSYPIITAYEFEFLKTEEIIQALLKPSSIYFIVQRPLIYISNLIVENGSLTFQITDDSKNDPLVCSIELNENNFLCRETDKEVLVEVQFYKKPADTVHPFNDVAAIKFFTLGNEFIVWYTPQKIIYEHFSGALKANIKGNIQNYIDYHVHYIGQAFSRDIWERLTGHEKMQSILTIENIKNNKALKNSFEISLIIMEVSGYDELNIMPYYEGMVEKGTEPILFDLESDDDFVEFNSPILATNAFQLTNEIEAKLINQLKPKYNKIFFENYPEIKSGTRSVGYSSSSLILEMLPALLSTDTTIVMPRSA